MTTKVPQRYARYVVDRKDITHEHIHVDDFKNRTFSQRMFFLESNSEKITFINKRENPKYDDYSDSYEQHYTPSNYGFQEEWSGQCDLIYFHDPEKKCILVKQGRWVNYYNEIVEDVEEEVKDVEDVVENVEEEVKDVEDVVENVEKVKDVEDVVENVEKVKDIEEDVVEEVEQRYTNQEVYEYMRDYENNREYVKENTHKDVENNIRCVKIYKDGICIEKHQYLRDGKIAVYYNIEKGQVIYEENIMNYDKKHPNNKHHYF